MDERKEQTIGPITKSSRVQVRQSLTGGGTQGVGAISESDLVLLEQLANDATTGMTETEALEGLRMGLTALDAHVLPHLAELVSAIEEIKRGVLDTQQTLEKKNPTESKLKFSFPIIPLLLSIETKYDLVHLLEHSGTAAGLAAARVLGRVTSLFRSLSCREPNEGVR